MPLYEYACEACGKRFERIRKFSDPPLDVCPNCGSGPVKKLISAPGFQFKGSGWYVTDYARKSDNADSSKASKDSKDSKESSSSSETSGEKPSTAASSEPSKDKPAASSDSTTKK